jgi:predicted oxidoreductase
VKQTNQEKLLQSVSREQPGQVRALLDQGADINVKENKSGQIENNEGKKKPQITQNFSLTF